MIYELYEGGIELNPEIKLRIIQGNIDLIGQVYHIQLQGNKENNLFKFGKNFKFSDYLIDDPTVSNKHFLLDYTQDYGWFIVENAKLGVKSHFGTYVYLAN